MLRLLLILADDHPRWAAALYNKCGTCEQWIKAEYNDQGAIIDTWGLQGLMTDAAIEAYCGESSQDGMLWAALSLEIIKRSRWVAEMEPSKLGPGGGSLFKLERKRGTPRDHCVNACEMRKFFSLSQKFNTAFDFRLFLTFREGR
jgi:hypothetical protein